MVKLGHCCCGSRSRRRSAVALFRKGLPAAASAEWRQRCRVAAILSGHGKPHLVRRMARRRCEARFRLGTGWSSIARAIRLTRRGFAEFWTVSLKSAAAGNPSRRAPRLGAGVPPRRTPFIRCQPSDAGDGSSRRASDSRTGHQRQKPDEQSLLPRQYRCERAERIQTEPSICPGCN